MKKSADTQPEMVETSFMKMNGSVVSEHTEDTEVLDMEIQGTSTTAGNGNTGTSPIVAKKVWFV